MATTFADHFLGPGDHASRPAASAVPQGALYSCTEHNLIYESDGSSTWTTYATLGGDGGTTVETETGTSYTPALSDENTYQRLTNASLVSVTVPTNASVAFDVGTEIALYAAGAGGVTVAGDTGVTVNDAGDIPEGAVGVLVKVDTDVWDLHRPTSILTEYADTVNALGNSSGTVTPDPSDGMWVTATLTGNITLDLSLMTAGQTLVLDITQDGTGSHTVGFTQTVEWPGGAAFSHTGTASSRDRIVVDYDGTTYTGNVVGQDYS